MFKFSAVSSPAWTDTFGRMSTLFYRELAAAVTSIIEQEAARLEELAGSFGAHACQLSNLGWPTAAASLLDRSGNARFSGSRSALIWSLCSPASASDMLALYTFDDPTCYAPGIGGCLQG
jgi:hypothetical protein